MKCKKYNTTSHVGRRFGSLTVHAEFMAFRTNGKRRDRKARCLCDCGTTVDVWAYCLTNSNTTTCGGRAHRVTHDMSKTPEYTTWTGMIQRCENPNTARYKRYGGRGITVCKRWAESFDRFIEDMGRKPSPQYSIERRNNNGNYEPSNCYWGTPSQQNRNMSSSRLITFDGTTLCAKDWALKIGMHYETFCYRVNHWPLAKVFSTPIRAHTTKSLLKLIPYSTRG